MLTVWSGAFILFVAAFAGWRVAGHAFAPVPVYCGTWAAALAVYALSARSFAPLYALDERTVCFVVAGALVFAAGVLVVKFVTPPLPPGARGAHQRVVREPVLFGLLVLVVAAVPAAYQHVRGLLPGVTLSELLYAARYVDTRAAGVGAAPVLGPFANLAPLSIALTLLLYAAPLPPGKRWIRSTMLLAALVTTVLAGGRSGAVIVLISVLALTAMRGELRARTLVGLGALFLTVFFAVALLVGKGGAGLDVSLEENVRLLLQGLRDYAVGGVVGFQRILLSPGEVASTGGATRTAAIILNHLGFHFDVPEVYSAYTMIGSGSDTNVYTIYYTYFDYGAAGALGLVFVLGGLIEALFSRARAGGTMALAVYSSLVAGMVTSVFAESFFTNINFLGKLLLCGFVLLKPLSDRSNDPSLLHS